MKQKSIKYLAYSITLLLALYGTVTSLPFLKAEFSCANSLNKVSNPQFKKLNQDKNWVNIKAFWKKLNSLEGKNDYNENFKQLQMLKAQIDSVNRYIETLKVSSLLTIEQSKYLTNLINERLHYLEFSMGTVKCYKMSQLGSQIVQTRSDLEKRYDTLEKLFKEDKIDQKTFDLTRSKIAEDIKFIDDNSYSDPKLQANDGITDLIILLNK